MGMYTQLKATIKLDYNHDDVDKVIKVLCHMLYAENIDIDNEISYFKHPLFETSRWDWMLNGSSAYFDEHEPSYLRDYVLYLDFDMKNYDNEIQKFLDWIRPYSVSRGKIGTYRYEEQENDSWVIFDEDDCRIESISHIEPENDFLWEDYGTEVYHDFEVGDVVTFFNYNNLNVGTTVENGKDYDIVDIVKHKEDGAKSRYDKIYIDTQEGIIAFYPYYFYKRVKSEEEVWDDYRELVYNAWSNNL